MKLITWYNNSSCATNYEMISWILLLHGYTGSVDMIHWDMFYSMALPTFPDRGSLQLSPALYPMFFRLFYMASDSIEGIQHHQYKWTSASKSSRYLLGSPNYSLTIRSRLCPAALSNFLSTFKDIAAHFFKDMAADFSSTLSDSTVLYTFYSRRFQVDWSRTMFDSILLYTFCSIYISLYILKLDASLFFSCCMVMSTFLYPQMFS